MKSKKNEFFCFFCLQSKNCNTKKYKIFVFLSFKKMKYILFIQSLSQKFLFHLKKNQIIILQTIYIFET